MAPELPEPDTMRDYVKNGRWDTRFDKPF